eukprot:6199279-Pleurochrysis_carterae.AAC.6
MMPVNRTCMDIRSELLNLMTHEGTVVSRKEMPARTYRTKIYPRAKALTAVSHSQILDLDWDLHTRTCNF